MYRRKEYRSGFSRINTKWVMWAVTNAFLQQNTAFWKRAIFLRGHNNCVPIWGSSRIPASNSAFQSVFSSFSGVTVIGTKVSLTVDKKCQMRNTFPLPAFIDHVVFTSSSRTSFASGRTIPIAKKTKPQTYPFLFYFKKKKKKACNEVPWEDYMQLNSICILTELASIFHWLKNFG